MVQKFPGQVGKSKKMVNTTEGKYSTGINLPFEFFPEFQAFPLNGERSRTTFSDVPFNVLGEIMERTETWCSINSPNVFCLIVNNP